MTMSITLQTGDSSRAAAGTARTRAFVAVVLGCLLLASAGCSRITERLALSNGNKLYKVQKYEEAIREYDKVLAIAPDHWYANYMKSVSLLALYHPGSTHPKDLEFAEKSVESFQKLLKLKAPDAETIDKIHGFYIGLLQNMGRADDAIAFFEGLVQQDATNGDKLTNMAQMYAKAGNFPKALEYYLKRAQIDPTNKEAWYTIGVVCWERSFKQAAMMTVEEREQVIRTGMESMDKALAIDSDYMSALAYYNLLWRERAKIAAEANDLTSAQEFLAKATELQKKALVILNRNKAPAAPPTKAGG